MYAIYIGWVKSIQGPLCWALCYICKFRGKPSNIQTFKHSTSPNSIEKRCKFIFVQLVAAQKKDWFKIRLFFDCKRKGGTYSWPSHSCAMASSGCRTCVRPERRTAPVPLSHRVASPSGFPSAWSSYISPLKERNKEKKIGKLSSVCYDSQQCVTNKKKKCAYMACFHLKNWNWVCMHFHISIQATNPN